MLFGAAKIRSRDIISRNILSRKLQHPSPLKVVLIQYLSFPAERAGTRATIRMCTYLAAVALPDAADASSVLRGSISKFNGDETGRASRHWSIMAQSSPCHPCSFCMQRGHLQIWAAAL
ncbi:hypothetical protein FIBSPDRAFT_875034 [Athelia psychrophila]|uniref:Uncharacterized protein n=1 Tax=Athelia psychrophila TaxID=1759441 RepID=A0A165WRP8_9AGAM|nr:hypothetical protein FIBSPDRAFT_875034 [Fibularhizoctonia sp. CBS 109695]